MTLGNLAALQQTNMKRLLAYSSIAQAGYALMGFVVLSNDGIRAMLFYLVRLLPDGRGRVPGRDDRRELRPAARMSTPIAVSRGAAVSCRRWR